VLEGFGHVGEGCFLRKNSFLSLQVLVSGSEREKTGVGDKFHFCESLTYTM